MFTDMKGFTSRTSVGSRKQVDHLLDLHDKLIRPIFAQFGGSIVKTIGDAFLVTFESPTDAVLSGMRIQRVVMKHNAATGLEDKFEIRIAINSGEVQIKNGDIFGEPVNIAARIESIAEPNEVYFTEAVYLSMNKNEIPSAEIGQRHLKGIPEQVKIYKVLKEKASVLRKQAERKNLVAKTANLPKDIPNIAPSSPAPDQALAPNNGTHNKTTTTIVIIVLAVLLSIAILLIVRSRREARSRTETQPLRPIERLDQSRKQLKSVVEPLLKKDAQPK